jgi:basic amino acid/polyamine antiporter, APA family
MQLYREVGLTSSVFLVVGNIVGVGIFTTSGLIAQEVGFSIWVLLVWIVGGALALVGALCYARLGIQFPKAGGEYAFLYPTFGPFSAFLSGWASLLIGFSAPIAASALGLAFYLRPFLPDSLQSTAHIEKWTAVCTLLLVGFFLSLGLKSGHRLHSGATFLNFSLAVVFSILVIWRAPFGERVAPLLTAGGGEAGLPSLAAAIVLVMFTYSGWNAAAYIAEEIRSPRKNIPAALLIGTIVVILLYLGMNVAYFSASPFDQLAGEVAVAEITAASVFGPVGRTLVTALILLSIFSSLTAMAIAGPRVYFAMSRDRLFPAWLSAVDPKRKAPLRSIWFQTLIALFLVLVGRFDQILLYSGFVLIVFSTLTVAALYKISSWRILPTIFIVVNGLVLFNAAVSRPWEALAGATVVALGIPVYVYYRRRKV